MTEASVQDPPIPSVPGAQVANYWGTDERHKFHLPDGVQWFEFKIMDEGAKSKFQKLTNQDLTINRDNTAKVRMDPAAERHTLITQSIVDWYLYMPKKGQEGVPNPEMEQANFSSAMLNNWLEHAPPKLVEDLEMEIRKANPWMQADMTSEAIQKEIDRLYEEKAKALEREAGEATSANK